MLEYFAKRSHKDNKAMISTNVKIILAIFTLLILAIVIGANQLIDHASESNPSLPKTASSKPAETSNQRPPAIGAKLKAALSVEQQADKHAANAVVTPIEYSTDKDKQAEEDSPANITEISPAKAASSRRELGYFSASEEAEYDSYDQETLISLAKSDDLLALQTYAKKAVGGGHYKHAESAYYRAAALGSVSSLESLAAMRTKTIDELNSGRISADEARKRFDLDKSVTNVNEHLTRDALAYYKVGELRGHGANITEQQNEFIEANNIRLNEEQEIAAGIRAEEL